MKKAIISFLIYVCGILPTLAQINRAEFDCPEILIPKYDKESRLYGYVSPVSPKGDWVVTPSFLKAELFSGSLARVQKGNKWGMINCDGYLIVAPEFDELKDFASGKAWGKKNNKWALIDGKGKIVVAPTFTDLMEIGDFSTLTWVQEKNELWGLFNKERVSYQITPQFKQLIIASDSISIVRLENNYGIVNNFKGNYVIEPVQQDVRRISASLYVYIKDKKWGAISFMGRKLLPQQYDTIYANNDLIMFKENGKFGATNYLGFPIFLSRYDSIGLVTEKHVVTILNGKFGLSNLQGKAVLNHEYDFVGQVKNGVCIIAKNQKYGIYSVKENKVLLAPQFPKIERNYSHPAFVVTTNEGKQQLYALNGTPYSKEIFDKIYWQDDAERMRVEKEKQVFFFDVNNNKYANALFFEAANAFENGLAQVKQNGKWGILNTLGTLTIPTLYEEVLPFFTQNKPYFKVKKDGKWGVADQNHKLFIPCQYDLVVKHGESHFVVKEKEKYGLLRNNGQVIIPPTYSLIANESEQTILQYFPLIVAKGNKYGLVSEKGEEILKPTYNEIIGLGANWFAFSDKKTKKYGLIDSKGTIALPAEYDQIRPFDNDMAAVSQNGKWGFINKFGKSAITPQYENVTDFFGKAAYAQQNGKWGAIDKNGKWLLKPEYSGHTLVGGKRQLVK